MKNNRRNFIKLAGIAAAGLAVAPKAMASGGGHSPASVNKDAIHAKHWACHRYHQAEYRGSHRQVGEGLPLHPQRSDHSEQSGCEMAVGRLIRPHLPGAGNPHLAEEVHQRAYPLLCNHCEEPSCVRVCPTKATFKRADGIVAMDYHRCIGCRYCMAACPFGSRSFNWGEPREYLDLAKLNPEFPTRMRGVVEKCNFCVERLAVGKLPACVEASRRHRFRRSHRSRFRCPQVLRERSPFVVTHCRHRAQCLLHHIGGLHA